MLLPRPVSSFEPYREIDRSQSERKDKQLCLGSPEMAQSYSHLGDNPLRTAADRISKEIQSAVEINLKNGTEVVSLAKGRM